MSASDFRKEVKQDALRCTVRTTILGMPAYRSHMFQQADLLSTPVAQ